MTDRIIAYIIMFHTEGALASSALSSDTAPVLAIDGKYETIFHSTEDGGGESYPWIQADLRNTVLVETVTIVNRIAGPDGYDRGNLFKAAEVRSGTQSLESDFKGPISINVLCGNFQGPGESGGIYTIKCEKVIASNHITLQLMSVEQTTLHITEILINEFKSVCEYILKFQIAHY